MNRILAFAALGALWTAPALAQEDHSGHGAATETAELPPACRDAAGSMGGMNLGQMMGGMGGMGNMMNGVMGNLDEVQKANMEAMMKMHGPMMQATMIKDPDLAFNCGMIAHHQGAIAMAEVELGMGKDEASKALAQRIIDEQRKEIAEMTAWVEQHAQQ